MRALDNHISLRDGRRLGYAEYGVRAGKPVLFFHGIPGSRLEHHPDQNIVKAHKLRIIAPDRPGYGISDPEPTRSIVDWADDIRELMDQLNIESCSIIGFSGGGPFAAACAYRIPERISQLCLINSMAPFDNPYGIEGMNERSQALFKLTRSDPREFEAQIQPLATDGETLLQIMTAELPPQDVRVFAMPGMAEMYRADMAEAIRQGVTGIVSDMLLLSRDWGFRLENISCKTYLWQGLEDINVPPDMGHYLAEAIPSCQSHFIHDHGHFLLFPYWKKIFTGL